VTEPLNEHDMIEEDWEDEGWDEEFENGTRSIIRAKWSFDGATTLSEAAACLQAYASDLLVMEQEGWQLESPIEDDYGFIVRKVSDK
jgi:hypothetical protein